MKEALSIEDFNYFLDDMKEMMKMVLRISFNNLNQHWKNEQAKSLYDSFFS